MFRHSVLIFLASITSNLVYAGVGVENGWARATPPGQHMAAAYMTLVNRGDAPLTLVGSASDVAQSAEIHHRIDTDGMSGMRAAGRVTLAPGESLDLAPGGTHLMLMGLGRRLGEGEQITVTFTLESGEEVSAQLPVLKKAP